MFGKSDPNKLAVVEVVFVWFPCLEEKHNKNKKNKKNKKNNNKAETIRKMKRSFLLPLFFLSLLVSFSTEADLILQREEKIEDLIGEDGEYEGSGCSLRDSVDELVVVLDNSDRLLIVDTDLDDARWETSSSGMEGFEGVTYDYQGSDLGDDEIFSVMESVEDDDGDYQAILYTFDSDFSLLGTQRLGGVEFESDNKGFEGLTLIRYEVFFFFFFFPSLYSSYPPSPPPPSFPSPGW